MCVCAVVKASYNIVPHSQGGGPEITDTVGGVCGSAFFTARDQALTANHILNQGTFSPNTGCAFCQIWLVGRNGASLEITSNQVRSYPEVDTSVISFDTRQRQIPPLTVAPGTAAVGDSVYNEGHIAGGGQRISFRVVTRGVQLRLGIARADLSRLGADGQGAVSQVARLTVDSVDVNLVDRSIIELSYGGRTGMSGGPLRLRGTGDVVGLMSFGLPGDSEIKQRLYAVSMHDILAILSK